MTALVESSGATSWSKTLASPVKSASTLDTRSGLVVVGESNGAVQALSTSSGSTKWTFTAGGAVNVSPMIIGGSVYVGSANGKVYALSEATGDQRWTHSIGSPITASPAYYVLNSQIFVGSSNRTSTALARQRQPPVDPALPIADHGDRHPAGRRRHHLRKWQGQCCPQLRTDGRGLQYGGIDHDPPGRHRWCRLCRQHQRKLLCRHSVRGRAAVANWIARSFQLEQRAQIRHLPARGPGAPTPVPRVDGTPPTH